jgi:uncharacterized protein (DUF433 family)
MVPHALNADRTQLVKATPGVCGGKACVLGTRIPVWAIERSIRGGCSIAEVVEMYPTLSPEGVQAALDYTRSHLDEINAQIAEHEGD